MDRDILQSWLSAATREVHHLYYLEGGEKTSFKVAAIINIGAKGAKQLLELAEHGHKGIKAMTMKGAMTIPAFAARFDGMLIVGIEISVQGLNLTSKIHLRELGKVLAANLNKPVADTGKTGMVIRAEQLLKGKHITPAEAEAAKGVTITCLQLEAVSTIGGIGVANTSNTKNRFILMLEFADEDGKKFTPNFFVQFLPVPVSASVETGEGDGEKILKFSEETTTVSATSVDGAPPKMHVLYRDFCLAHTMCHPKGLGCKRHEHKLKSLRTNLEKKRDSVKHSAASSPKFS